LTSSLVAGSDSWLSHIENAGHMYVVPFFLSESMYSKNIHHQALASYQLKLSGNPPKRNAPTLTCWLLKVCAVGS